MEFTPLLFRVAITNFAFSCPLSYKRLTEIKLETSSLKHMHEGCHLVQVMCFGIHEITLDTHRVMEFFPCLYIKARPA